MNNNCSYTLENIRTNKEKITQIYGLLKLNASEAVIYNTLGYEYINNLKNDEIIIKINNSISETELLTKIRKIRDEIKKAILTVPSISSSNFYEVRNVKMKNEKPINIFSHNPSLVSIDESFLKKIK